MEPKRIFINGASGRIGTGVTHEFFSNPLLRGLEVVAMNDSKGIDYTTGVYNENDSVHGLYNWAIRKIGDKELSINSKPIRFYKETDLSKIPFEDLGIDVVMECSGFYGDPKKDNPKAEDSGGREFLKYGVKRVIETYPAKTADISMIFGCNSQLYDPAKHRIISNASCTTKSIAGPLKVLLDNGFDIDDVRMVTVHAATGSQQVLESIGQIVLHSTGAAKATGLVLPVLKGKMGGTSARVPTLDGSISYVSVVAYSCNPNFNADEINNLYSKASMNPIYEQRIGLIQKEKVNGKEPKIGTNDIIGRRENALIVPSETQVGRLRASANGMSGYHIWFVSGYDNELGSAVDPCLLAKYILQDAPKSK